MDSLLFDAGAMSELRVLQVGFFHPDLGIGAGSMLFNVRPRTGAKGNAVVSSRSRAAHCRRSSRATRAGTQRTHLYES